MIGSSAGITQRFLILKLNYMLPYNVACICIYEDVLKNKKIRVVIRVCSRFRVASRLVIVKLLL